MPHLSKHFLASLEAFIRYLIFAFVVLAASLAGAQTVASPDVSTNDSDTTLHAKAQLVEVDVVVTDRQGNPVHKLQASDFSVFENKSQQTVKSFDEHDGGETAVAASVPPGVFSNELLIPQRGSVDVLLLDSLNTPPESQPYLRDQLVNYLNHAKPGTRLAIFALNSRLRMLQGLTSDPALLKQAIQREGVKFSPLLERDLNDSDVHQSSEMISDLIEFQPELAAVLLQVQSLLLDSGARMSSNKTQDRARTTLAALNELARYLAGVPGRKNVIWFSGSFPSVILRDQLTTGDPLAGYADLQAEVSRTTELLARSRVAVSPVDARGLEMAPSQSPSEAGGTGNLQRTQQVYGTSSLNPRDSQFYVTQTGEHQTMEDIADSTGGMAVFNTNGLSSAMDKLMNSAQSYYTIAYTPPQGARAGERREIAVKLKGSGYHLAYRHEYITEATPEQLIAIAAAPPPGGSSALIGAAMAEHTSDATEVLFEVSPKKVATPAAGDPPAAKAVGEAAFSGGPSAQYLLTMDVDAKTISFTQAADGKMHGVVDFVVVLYDAKGKQLDSKLNRAVLALEPERYKGILSGGLRFHFNVDLAAQGDQVVRLGVHDAVTDHVGTLELSASAIRGSGDVVTK
ncbi:VWA domain-containing protein [Tunturiibacter lichenicola]|uniref:VWA domain-containing protein n=1 Tax=Tunturiibacter lichenicola TaxID=2051959 RepID=UPI0021B16360|nr:VWA domain-containing protein [Edaphobacter lichenicola]